MDVCRYVCMYICMYICVCHVSGIVFVMCVGVHVFVYE